MDLDVLWQQGVVIAGHALFAFAAVVVGGVQLSMEKGTTQHRILGAIWVTMMVVVAVSSFWIHEFRMFGPFSVIHILSVFTLLSLGFSIWSIRSGRVRLHRASMISMYVLALLVTGGFTFLPGRTMYLVFFGV